MSLDYSYYYDFGTEIRLENWVLLEECQGHFRMEHEVETGGGLFLLLSDIPSEILDGAFADVQKATCNGQTVEFDRHLSYVGYAILRKSAEIQLPPGKCTLVLEGLCGRNAVWREQVKCALAQPMTQVQRPARWLSWIDCPREDFPAPGSPPDIAGFRPGIGCEHIPGRFGFSKGDGVLDCAMPALGTVDKLYLLGHPQYKKNFRWNYSTLPEGAALHGSFAPANQGIEGDKIDVNHLSARWETQFNGMPYACTYSLASPGIITENASGIMRISNLKFAGNYQYMMFPKRDGKLEITTIGDGADLDLGRNFLLLFGCTEFPDVPLLLVFQEKPRCMRAKFEERTGRLAELLFTNCPLLITATPFGIESFQPIKPDDAEFLAQAAKLCLLWSRALLAYPVKCQEYYRNNPDTQTTDILQKFSYRIIRDAWETKPLELAPLPPIATLDGNTDLSHTSDFHFPTKYGYLRGAFGSASAYSLPWMPSHRKFPLRNASDNSIANLLKQGMSEYWDFVSQFPSSRQSYPYSGSQLEAFALPSTQMFFMDAEDKRKFRTFMKERLELACQEDFSYDYPLLDHGYLMETMPEDEEVVEYFKNLKMKRLFNWYERFEPFTGAKFTICYLNVCCLHDGSIKEGTKEEIRDLKLPLIENDWGVGLSFYYMYLAALATGSFSQIRRNWKLLNSAFSFFEKMQDWACMGTGYSDNAILWVEGANYGAFTSFINMAQALGDEDALERAQYLAAKQFSLRKAIFRSSSCYYCKYYGVAPWHTTKIIEEEQNPYWQHIGVPVDMDELRLRDDVVYNLTTEGLYPELFEAFQRFIPEDTSLVMEKLREFHHRLPPNADKTWHFTQQAVSLLTYMAQQPNYSRKELLREIQLEKDKLRWMGKWRGIHIFSRRLPENYLEAQLLAWEEMKQHPIWLEHWQDICIDDAQWDAQWDGQRATVDVRLSDEPGAAPLLIFGIRKEPCAVTMNGSPLPYSSSQGMLELALPASGKLILAFGQ